MSVCIPGYVNLLHILVITYAVKSLILDSLICIYSCNQIYYYQCIKGTTISNLQSDLACVGGDLAWHLDLASFWTEICGGVQGEEGGQCTLVGQGDSP